MEKGSERERERERDERERGGEGGGRGIFGLYANIARMKPPLYLELTSECTFLLDGSGAKAGTIKLINEAFTVLSVL